MPKLIDKYPGQQFDEKDFEILMKVIKLHPELELIAYATKQARAKLTYPIKSYRDLAALSNTKAKTLSFRGETINMKQVRMFIPKDFFPIESEDQFIIRMLIAFMIGHTSHQKEAELPNEALFDAPLNPKP